MSQQFYNTISFTRNHVEIQWLIITNSIKRKKMYMKLSNHYVTLGVISMQNEVSPFHLTWYVLLLLRSCAVCSMFKLLKNLLCIFTHKCFEIQCQFVSVGVIIAFHRCSSSVLRICNFYCIENVVAVVIIGGGRRSRYRRPHHRFNTQLNATFHKTAYIR